MHTHTPAHTHAVTLVVGAPDRMEGAELVSQTHLQTAVIQICALGWAQHAAASFSDALAWTFGWSRGRQNAAEPVQRLCQRERDGTEADSEKL